MCDCVILDSGSGRMWKEQTILGGILATQISFYLFSGGFFSAVSKLVINIQMFSPISQLILLEVKSIEKVGEVLFSFFPKISLQSKTILHLRKCFYEY